MTQDIIDLLNRLSKLSDDDLKVLRTLSDVSIMPVEIAAELYILPSQVTDSLERLSKNGFIVKAEQSQRKWLESDVKAVQLSSEGKDAQIILPLVERSKK
jgi:DNA-binding MarR family transcriptional regulator